jgi:hypothetical protein
MDGPIVDNEHASQGNIFWNIDEIFSKLIEQVDEESKRFIKKAKYDYWSGLYNTQSQVGKKIEDRITESGLTKEKEIKNFSSNVPDSIIRSMTNSKNGYLFANIFDHTTLEVLTDWLKLSGTIQNSLGDLEKWEYINTDTLEKIVEINEVQFQLTRNLKSSFYSVNMIFTEGLLRDLYNMDLKFVVSEDFSANK